MMEGLENTSIMSERYLFLRTQPLYPKVEIEKILSKRVRSEKVAIKDIKLHVYCARQ